jgi:DNA-binding transcriptional LysR family regulator
MRAAMQLSDRIGRRMKLQDLHVLLTVVQAGTMGKAAERLNTSQPNISRAISELEHALGVRLLDRHRQGIEPTEFGRALLDGGMAVFDELRQTVKNIEFLADPAGGEVRIGSIMPLAAGFITSVVDRLSRRYPRIVFRVAVTEMENLHRELCDRTVDLVMIKRVGPFDDDRFTIDTLFQDSYVVVAGAGHPLARKRQIKLAALMDQQWVLPPPDTVHGSVLSHAFHACGLAYPHVAVLTVPSEVRINLLATGRFLTIFPMSVLKFRSGGPTLKILPIDLPVAPVPVGLVTLKNRTLSPTAKLFIEHARDVARPLAKAT